MIAPFGKTPAKDSSATDPQENRPGSDAAASDSPGAGYRGECPDAGDVTRGGFAGSIETGARLRETDRPTRARIGEWVGDYLTAADLPDFKIATSVWHSYAGQRPHGLEGAIVRFDAGRTAPPDGKMRDHWGALNTLAWNQRQGLCSVVLARDGSIFLPANFSWNLWGRHAGDAVCPHAGRADVNQSCIGIEINGVGQLYPTPDPDCFVPWFNAVRDLRGQVRFNAYGEARRLDPADEWYRRADVAMVADRHNCIDAGVYAPMTKAQHEALIILLLWLQRTFPASFRLAHVYSAFEAARIKGGDEGAGVGFFETAHSGKRHQTMADFRSELQARWSVQQARMAYSYFHANRFAR